MHVENIHIGTDTSFCDLITKFSSIKVLHGICQQEKYYQDKQRFLSIALKLSCKTPNEYIVESMGSIVERHAAPQRNTRFYKYKNEVMRDWNGPTLAKSKPLIARVLDRKYGARKNWHFKTGSNKFAISKVLDRKLWESSALSFLE